MYLLNVLINLSNYIIIEKKKWERVKKTVENFFLKFNLIRPFKLS